jgi:penicillin-binding protein 2
VVVALGVGLAFLLLGARLYYVQILRGEEFVSRGRSNFITRLRTPHDRGIIYDRHGEILVDNRPSLNVEVTPYFLGRKKEESKKALGELFLLLNLDAEEWSRLEEKVLGQRGLNRFRPIVIRKDVSSNVLAAIEARRGVFEFDGVEIVPGRRRKYVHGKLAAHLIGYVNEIDRPRLDREIRKGNPRSYRRGDLLGRAGVEYQHEAELRGEDGFRKVVVDAKGRPQPQSYISHLIEGNQRLAPRPGNNLYLTIDRKLQEAAEAAFSGRAGSLVALDPRSGEVRAMVSVPDFDPNELRGLMAPNMKKELDQNILKPWLNRSLQGQYAPGSVFKVVTALAGFKAGVVGVHDKINCPGHFRMGNYTWRCHRESGHGMVDLKQALKFSCDTYFYSIASRIGIEPIAAAGRLLGLGARTGIPLRGEKKGNMPDEAFHDRVERRHGGYQRGMAVNTAIGQGAVLTTPLQVAVMYASLVNGGRVLKPQLVKRLETPDYRIERRVLKEESSEGMVETVEGKPPALIWELEPEVRQELNVSKTQLKAIQAGLIAAVQEPGGTAWSKRSKVVSVAGKTGTAQVVRLGGHREKTEDMAYFTRDHAWFASYAPVDKPELVVVVLNEHGGHGGSKAAPIAMKVIDAYFNLKRERNALAQATVAGEGEAP